jgi:O-antigen/teichoic acid export membrane protein
MIGGGPGVSARQTESDIPSSRSGGGEIGGTCADTALADGDPRRTACQRATESPREAIEGIPRRATAERARLGRNLGALAGGQVVTWTMTLLWTLVVPRALGPGGLGILVSAQSVSGVLGIVLGLGTRNYVVREIVMHREDGPKLVGTALVLRVILAPVVGLAAILWARVAHYDHEATVALYLITCMTILTLVAEPMQAAFQAIERMKYLALADIINKSALSMIGIALVLVGFKVTGIAALMAVMAGVVVLLNAVWLRRFMRIDLRTNLAMVANVAKHSLAFWATGIFGMVYLWIDTIMLSLMTPSHVVGWYGATTQIFQTLLFIPVLVSTAWLPRLVASFKQSHQHLTETARAPLEFLAVIGAPVAAGTAMVAPVVIRVTFGAAFAPAVPVMVVLAFCIPLMSVNIMLNQISIAAKRQGIWTGMMAGAAVVNPIMNLVLIPATQLRYHNGAIGAAISLVLTELLMNVAGFIVLGGRVLDRRGVRRVGLSVVASAGMLGAATAARPLGTLPSLLVGATALVVLFAKLDVATRDEKTFLHSGVARVRSRLVARSPS